jgi:hypothetical protein
MPDKWTDYVQEAAAACWLDDWAREEQGRKWGPCEDGPGFEAEKTNRWGRTVRLFGVTRQELLQDVNRD